MDINRGKFDNDHRQSPLKMDQSNSSQSRWYAFDRQTHDRARRFQKQIMPSGNQHSKGEMLSFLQLRNNLKLPKRSMCTYLITVELIRDGLITGIAQHHVDSVHTVW